MALFSNDEKRADALRAAQRKEAWKESDRKRRETGAQVLQPQCHSLLGAEPALPNIRIVFCVCGS